MLNEIRENTPDLIIRLFQKRLLDPVCEITQEELLEAEYQLHLEVKFLTHQLEKLQDKRILLKRLILKENLFEPGAMAGF